jgi:outer membrane immunogenic protein
MGASETDEEGFCMRRSLAGATAALLLLTSSAAADGPSKEPPAPVHVVYAPTWSGPYFGAGIGYTNVSPDLFARDSAVVPGTEARFDDLRTSKSNGGVFGTVVAGWDWQITPKILLGVFADYDFSHISGNVVGGDLVGDVYNFRANLDHQNLWAAGMRLGWLHRESMLFYGTVGYTQAEFGVVSTVRLLGADPADDDVDAAKQRSRPTIGGYFVGGGVDTRLNENWFVRLEYRYSRFTKTTTIHPQEGYVIDLEPSMQSARLSLTYKLPRTP